MPVVLQHKELICMYWGIWHHSVISTEVGNDAFFSDYKDGAQFGCSLDIVIRQLIVTRKVLHIYSDWS